MALLASSSAWAQCTSPNNTTCTVSAPQANGAPFRNGDNATGVLNINPGPFTNTSDFYNGHGYGYGNDAVGTGNGVGTATIAGTFNNNSGASFTNGYGYGYGYGFNYNPGILGSGTGTGTLTLESGGTFNNAGSFVNGHGYGYGYADGNGFARAEASGHGTGTVVIKGGGNFSNTGTFTNGYGVGRETSIGGDGIGNGTGVGILTIESGGTFSNAGSFVNGLRSGTGTGTGTGTVSIESGGTFLNDTTGTIEQNPASSFSNAGTFINNGTLTGSGGLFSNLQGGVFQHFAGNAIGASGHDVPFTNAGTFNIGHGNASLATTALNGTYTQTATGTLALRADWAAGTSDKLAVTGNATLAGTVVVTALNFPSTPNLTKTFADIVTTTGTLDAAALTATNTAAVSYTLDKKTQAIDLIATINFQGVGIGGLPTNQASLGGALNGIYGGGTTLGFMPALMGLPTNAALSTALNQLAPSGDSAGNASTLQTGSTFAQQLLSCRTVGEGDAYAVIREGQCVWARGTVRHAEIGNGSGFGATETAPFVSTGAQINLGGPWRLGGGIGYEAAHLRTDAGSISDTDRLHLGGVIKYNPGPLLLAATITGGFGWTDTERHVNFGGFAATATSKNDSDFLSGRLTAAYLMPFSGFYLKPQVEVAHTYLSRDGYTEHGTGGIALDVAGTDANIWTASPTLEVGTQLALGGGGVARPFIRTGMTWRDKDTFLTSAAFADAPGSAPFTVASKIDRTTFDLAAGVDLITAGETALRVQYDGQFGDTISQHTASAKLSFRF